MATKGSSTKTAAPKKAPVKRGAPRKAAPAKKGDRILIDSAHVGSPPREGEVLRVIHGDASVSYEVRWADGHESFITPVAGTARLVRK